MRTAGANLLKLISDSQHSSIIVSDEPLNLTTLKQENLNRMRFHQIIRNADASSTIFRRICRYKRADSRLWKIYRLLPIHRRAMKRTDRAELYQALTRVLVWSAHGASCATSCQQRSVQSKILTVQSTLLDPTRISGSFLMGRRRVKGSGDCVYASLPCDTRYRKRARIPRL